MALASNLGFPRIGQGRELKYALEAYWEGRSSGAQLEETAAELRARHWKLQHELGIDLIPSNDFSLYDHVLDTTVLVGAIPERFRRVGKGTGEGNDLDTYFAMARGESGTEALEMTKWFDTNYHYIVPELRRDQQFVLVGEKPIEEFNEALALGIVTKPVLLGPITYLTLAKPEDGAFEPLELLERLLPVYETVLARLQEAGARWVQIDEPALVLERSGDALARYEKTYQRLGEAAPDLKILLATYFEGVEHAVDRLVRLPIGGLHLDLVRRPDQLERALAAGVPEPVSLSLGVIDGRNIWKTDWEKVLLLLETTKERVGSERLIVAPSCSLLHVPIDLELETGLDDEVRSWVAFAKQKLEEVVCLTTALNEGRDAIKEALAANQAVHQARKASTRVHRSDVNERLNSVTETDFRRASPYGERAAKQRERWPRPLLPTTTIGSFPQTEDVRQARARWRRGELSDEAYTDYLKARIKEAIGHQIAIGLDVLVHGEFERNDMVEYFAEHLDGFALTTSGWVQSYGSRCVKPPIIYGDVFRPGPITVEWARYAQSLTEQPVKGMLTGPVTIVKWSFVRDDQPVERTCRQVALALRDEVLDLEAAGLPIIQIDEAAFREGLPLREEEREAYFAWAVDAFRLASAGVKDETQIHTHMCYSDFNEIIRHVAALDADVISIEASRSRMELLDAFVEFNFPNEIGPGVYDIHSPRVPSVEEQAERIRSALRVLDPEQVWVNPDCGLKTRRWEEVLPALKNMVDAAGQVRSELAKGALATTV